MNLKALVLKDEKYKILYNQNSWIYSGAIKSADKNIKDGEIIRINTENGKLAAYAFYFKGENIIAYVFDFTTEEKDVLTYDYWKYKIFSAYKFKQKLIPPKTNIYRLIHSEGDTFPGLTVDIYNNTAVVEFRIFGTELVSLFIFKALEELGFQNIFVKKSYSGKLDKKWIKSIDNQGVILTEEYGLKFYVDIINGQKTGFFIDQRENRKLLKNYSAGKIVLNLFSYTGGFGIYALSGGARCVHSVDISKQAVSLAVKNATLNGFNEHQHIGVVENAFDYLIKMPENYYDLIIIDPPAFAKNDQAIKKAAKGYKELNFRAIKKIKENGIIFTFSCSQKIDNQLFRKIVFSAAADAKRKVKILHQLHQAPDHPIDIFQPKSEYLKGYVLFVE